MATKETCETCRGPECADGRGEGGRDRDLTAVLLGNQVRLLRCPACAQLWCYSGQSPGARVPKGVVWPYTLSDWQRVYDLDDGISLRRWHRKRVKELLSPG